MCDGVSRCARAKLATIAEMFPASCDEHPVSPRGGETVCLQQRTVPKGGIGKERKGKERKEVYLYSAFIVATTLKALRRGSHSFTCK